MNPVFGLLALVIALVVCVFMLILLRQSELKTQEIEAENVQMRNALSTIVKNEMDENCIGEAKAIKNLVGPNFDEETVAFIQGLHLELNRI